MGEIIEFPSNGTTGQGYLAAPEGARDPGWWSSRSGGGWSTTSRTSATVSPPRASWPWLPDLYRGKTITEPDEAAKEMMAMQLDARPRT